MARANGFPALIIDRYGDTLVLKLYTSAWLPYLEALIGALEDAIVFDNLVLRLSRALQSDRLNVAKVYGLEDGQQLLGAGADEPVTFVENGLLFQADVRRGHKTGFFFDQRDNRQKVRELAKGRRVLDVFSYTGGFLVYALAGGARTHYGAGYERAGAGDAEGQCGEQRLRSQLVDVMAGDAFAGLMQLIQARRQFNMVIVDPPAFANSRASMRNAVMAYRRLVEMALRLLAKDGVLMMASARADSQQRCSLNWWSARRRWRGFKLEVIDKTGHALDHPVGFPEAAYLKALFARVRK